MKDTVRRQTAPVGSSTHNTHLIIFNKTYEGYVIDRIDKDAAGKVKVYIPELFENNPSIDGIWCRVVNKSTEGEYLIPNINQWVTVKFLYGDPNYPIIEHVLGSWEEIHPAISKNWHYFTEGVRNPESYTHGEFNLTSQEVHDAPDWHIMQFTPKVEHMISIMDNKNYHYIELRTGESKHSYQMNDKYDAIGTYTKENKRYVFLEGKNPENRIEINTNKKSVLTFENKKQYTELHGYNQECLGFHNNNVILSNTVKTDEKGPIPVGSNMKNKLDSQVNEIKVSDDIKYISEEISKAGSPGNTRSIVINESGIFITTHGAVAKFLDNGFIYLN